MCTVMDPWMYIVQAHRTHTMNTHWDGFFQLPAGVQRYVPRPNLCDLSTWNQPAKTEENQPTGDVFGVKIASEFGETQETINSWLSFLSVFRF